MRLHRRSGALAAGLVVVVLGSGCVTMKPMALSKDAQTIPVDAQQSLALAAVKVKNVYKTGQQPHVKSVRVKATGPDAKELAFNVEAPYRASPDEGNQFEEILVSLALPPGEYEVMSVHVTAGGFPVFGNGWVPVNATFKLPAAKAVYLGRIEALRRERIGDEPRAGPVIPLIDQAVTGFSGGTFEVKLFDGYDYDLPLMKTEYPALQKVEVEKAFLVPKPPEPKAAPAEQKTTE